MRLFEVGTYQTQNAAKSPIDTTPVAFKSLMEQPFWPEFKAYWKAKKQIYRGDSDINKNLAVLSPGVRLSRNTWNFYTTVMSESPAWSHLPPRNTSFICSTDYNYARSYARSGKGFFIVFPLTKPWKAAQVNSQDIWGSISEQLSLLRMGSIHQIWYTTMNMMGQLAEASGLDNDAPYSQLEERLSELTIADIPWLDKFVADKDSQLTFRGQTIPKDSSLWTLLNLVIDPSMAYSVPDISHLQEGYETWISGPCLFVRREIWRDVTDLVNGK